MEDVGVPASYDSAEGLSNIKSIPTKKTLMLVNFFIVNTVDFMNKFAALCERKLARVATHTQKLEVMLALLEAKLESVPYLDDAAPQQQQAEQQPQQQYFGGGGDAPAAAPEASQPAAAAAAPADAGAPPLPPSPPAAPAIMVKDDSRYSRFFRMMRMGVHKESVRMKMSVEAPHLDVGVLDWEPEAPAPEGAVHVKDVQE